MRILVTGGAGYIGTTLVPMLLNLDHEVVVFDSLRFGLQPLLPFLRNPRLSLQRADIRDRRALKEAARNMDAIVHLAAIVGHPACAAAPDDAQTVNVEGTRNLAAVIGCGRPIIFTSTSSCYGSVPEGTCDEDTPLHPVSLYGSTKAHAEAILLDTSDTIVYRVATAYGLSPRLRLDLLVNHFVHQALHEHRIALYQSSARRSFIHVQDVARAIIMALEQSEAMLGRVYNVGDENQNLTKMDLCRAIQQVIPGVEIDVSLIAQDPDRRDYLVSYARIRDLGFRPKITLAEGIRELAGILRWIDRWDSFGNLSVAPG
jgi:nucleoside-diphosphate-sugar epimerase